VRPQRPQPALIPFFVQPAVDAQTQFDQQVEVLEAGRNGAALEFQEGLPLPVFLSRNSELYMLWE
jgi:hypothetical protein